MRSLFIVKAISIALLLLSSIIAATAQTFTLDSTVLTADTVITGLNVPWELKWGTDNHLWMTERDGKVSRVSPQTGTKEVLLDMTTANGGIVHQVGEAGMLGFDFHPNFPDSNYLYIAYTHRSNGVTYERLSRFSYNGDSLINELYIIDSIIANTYHAGARVVIGPDDKIYMTTGDALNQPSAQDINSLSGKTLRVNLDGSIPIDNPVPNSPLWSWGHRNPQGLHFGPTGILYSSEHGPNNDDEVNIIHPARNYGWPTVMGLCNTSAEMTFCNDSNVVESIYNWTPTIAPSDMVYFNHPAIPEWQGSLLLCVLKNKRIVRLTLNAAGDSITTETSYFVNQWGRLRDICIAPDGTVYLATNGASPSNTDPNTHSIIRLQNLTYFPPLAVNAGADLSVCAGNSVTINASTSGGASPLNYSWSPTTGLSCNNCLNPVASPASNTTYVLSVTDAQSNTSTDTVTVNVVNQPGAITYAYTIIDSFGNPPMVEFAIGAPGADSVIVIVNQDTTTILNSQNFSTIDSVTKICTTADIGGCSLRFNLCIHAFSPCGTETLCDTVEVTIEIWDGITSPNAVPFGMFPNPTNDVITLSSIEVADKITILNTMGKVVKQLEAKNNANSFEVDFSALPKGIYFVKVERNGITGTQKLIKQ